MRTLLRKWENLKNFEVKVISIIISAFGNVSKMLELELELEEFTYARIPREIMKIWGDFQMYEELWLFLLLAEHMMVSLK